MLKNLGQPKILYVLIKTTTGPAKAGGTCLILNEFAILMRHKNGDFKSWTWPKTLVVSLLKNK